MVDWFNSWMKQWFTARAESPLGHVLALRNIAFFITKHNTLLGDISVLGPDILKYRDIRISCDELRAFLVHGITICQPDLLELWFQNMIRDSQPTWEIQNSRARAYLKASQAFLRKLLALCHMISGSLRVLLESLFYLVLVYLCAICLFEEFLVLHLTKELPLEDFLLFFNMELSKLTYLGPRLTVSPWRHITQAFIRHGMKEDPLAYFGDNADDPNDSETLAARQIHYSRDRGQKTYGRLLVSFEGVVPDAQAAMTVPRSPGKTPLTRAISIGEFKEFLSLYGAKLGGEAEIMDPGQLDQAQLIRASRAKTTREFLQDDSATFRSPEQRVALNFLLRKFPFLFIILPTTGGKTTLFLLGASLATQQITIIISPLVALKIDLFNKAKALGLYPVLWDNNTASHVTTRLLLVSIELVKHPKFLGFLEGLAKKNGIERIIWDESILTVFSSVTLSPATKNSLLSMMKLDRFHGEIPTVHGDVTLQNMAYHVIETPKEASLVSELQYLVAKKTFDNKGVTPGFLVFCMTKRLVHDVYTALVEYYGETIARVTGELSDTNKAAELSRVKSGEPFLLLATSALGAGFDFTKINVVVHLEGAWGISDFIQESGRAGRNPASRGWSYCLVTSDDKRLRQNDNPERQEHRKYLNEEKAN
ncbi:P-loop containing nucleoside triphosphate hydrolase protein [Aspergillus multicolor]|uniref:DEAD/DEAH box helicase n=1 Tax=Aspergillus multicolor TaxID=41759 RepID=UPI003CCE1298